MNNTKIKKVALNLSLFAFLSIVMNFQGIAQYTETIHRELKAGEEPLSEPGSYDVAGTTYVLVNDISSDMTPVFLGNDVTFDLNGYTITYADGDYEHLSNYSFEEGLVDWDFSKAPNAKIEDTKVQVFVGDKVLRLRKDEEITSQFINLPVANRSYFAMCGVTGSDMSVSVYVEDESGEQVECINRYGRSEKQGCPVEGKSPRLGGGFVYAHLKDLPAGKYRIRVKANTDCLVDHIDIRPAMDVGIGIVERTRTYAHNDQLYDGWWGHSAFYDYTEDFDNHVPKEGIPVVSGEGTITIKNGIIKSGATGILSWGIESTAGDVKIILDNVKIISSGINTNAAYLPQADITNCTFDIQSPFIINRHGSSNYAIDLGDDGPSNVSNCEFYGGQGCLSYRSEHTVIHDNLFVNRQTVTNHYSIMTGADKAKIYRNRFEPEIGSGIEIYRKKDIEIFENEFYIESAPPSCEYGHSNYSTNGIRLADYGAEPGAEDGCYGNKIYNNKFYITGKDYPEYEDYVPVATAFFYSTSGGDNYIFNNEIVIDALDPASKAETVGFYVGGGSIGGEFKDNTITSNVPSFWIASMYGSATGCEVNNNTIIKSQNASGAYVPVRLGYYNYLARDIEFRSNILKESELEFGGTSAMHTYSVFWTLAVNVVDSLGNPAEGKNVQIINANGTKIYEGETPDSGKIIIELEEYSFLNRLKNEKSPYRIVVGGADTTVTLNKNTEITVLADDVTKAENVAQPQEFVFSPNPVRSRLNIKFGNRRDRTILIFDANQRIYSEMFTKNEQIDLKMDNFPSGVYFIKIMENGKVRTKKIIKN